MNCPYCSKEMASGYFHDFDQPLHWIPDGEKPSSFKFDMAKNGVKLKYEYGFLKGYRAAAYYCADCKMVLTATEE